MPGSASGPKANMPAPRNANSPPSTRPAAAAIAALAKGNREYEDTFGHIYLVFADGRSAEDLLALLWSGCSTTPSVERDVARAELGKINRIQPHRLLGDVESPFASSTHQGSRT